MVVLLTVSGLVARISVTRGSCKSLLLSEMPTQIGVAALFSNQQLRKRELHASGVDLGSFSLESRFFAVVAHFWTTCDVIESLFLSKL